MVILRTLCLITFGKLRVKLFRGRTYKETYAATEDTNSMEMGGRRATVLSEVFRLVGTGI